MLLLCQVFFRLWNSTGCNDDEEAEILFTEEI